MVIRAALLDEQGIFLRMDQVKSKAALTERHVPTITECDLPPNKYKWVADKENPYGGAFEPLPKQRKPTEH